MIKGIIAPPKLLMAVLMLCAAACSNTKSISQKGNTAKAAVISRINALGAAAPQPDSTLQALQQAHDITIAFATLNYAWARRANWYVLAGKNNAWKGYSYSTSLGGINGNGKAKGMQSFDVPADSANAIVQLYNQYALEKTTGSEKGTECPDSVRRCNIMDAESWSIVAGTPAASASASYYAPQFYERCCPGNQNRIHFIEVAKKISALFIKADEE